MTTISIIGTAGRSDGHKMTPELFAKMITKAKDIIENVFHLDPKNIILVSGGAAWSDHVVVDLFLDEYVKNTLLYLPCDWDNKNGNFSEKKWDEDKGKYTDCEVGLTANKYHQQFSKKLGWSTLEEIKIAIERGLKINTEHYGFWNRNTYVAKSDYLIAFSWSDDDEPGSPGTLDTWKKCKSDHKVHVQLSKI